MILDTDLCEDSEKALTTNDLTVEKIENSDAAKQVVLFLNRPVGHSWSFGGYPTLCPKAPWWSPLLYSIQTCILPTPQPHKGWNTVTLHAHLTISERSRGGMCACVLTGVSADLFSTQQWEQLSGQGRQERVMPGNRCYLCVCAGQHA